MIASVSGISSDLVKARSDQPQHGVNYKKRKHADKKQIHEKPYEIERGVQPAIVCICMGLVLNEALVGAFVAFSAGDDQVCLVDRRSWI